MLPNEIDTGRAIIIAALIIGMVWMHYPPRMYTSVYNAPPLLPPEPMA